MKNKILSVFLVFILALNICFFRPVKAKAFLAELTAAEIVVMIASAIAPLAIKAFSSSPSDSTAYNAFVESEKKMSDKENTLKAMLIAHVYSWFSPSDVDRIGSKGELTSNDLKKINLDDLKSTVREYIDVNDLKLYDSELHERIQSACDNSNVAFSDYYHTMYYNFEYPYFIGDKFEGMTLNEFEKYCTPNPTSVAVSFHTVILGNESYKFIAFNDDSQRFFCVTNDVLGKNLWTGSNFVATSTDGKTTITNENIFTKKSTYWDLSKASQQGEVKFIPSSGALDTPYVQGLDKAESIPFPKTIELNPSWEYQDYLEKARDIDVSNGVTLGKVSEGINTQTGILEWIKSFVETIANTIASIWNFISTFFTRLLDFVISIFVPKELNWELYPNLRLFNFDFFISIIRSLKDSLTSPAAPVFTVPLPSINGIYSNYTINFAKCFEGDFSFLLYVIRTVNSFAIAFVTSIFIKNKITRFLEIDD